MVMLTLPAGEDFSRSTIEENASLVRGALSIGPSFDLGRRMEIRSLALNREISIEGLERSPVVGWLYVVSQAGNIIGGVEVALDDRSEFHYAGALQREFVEAIGAGIQVLENLEGESPGSYTLRVLRIPAAFASFLWAEGGGDHILLPLPPIGFGLSGKPIRKASIVEELRRIERKASTMPAIA